MLIEWFESHPILVFNPLCQIKNNASSKNMQHIEKTFDAYKKNISKHTKIHVNITLIGIIKMANLS